MDYRKYFDELPLSIPTEEAEKIIDILKDQVDNPEVTEYNGLSEVVFELLLALWNDENYTGIEELRGLLMERYPKVYKREKGQFLSILMEWYLKKGNEERAAEAWREWYQANYDYDLIRDGLDVLVLYHQSLLVEEFIDREFQKVKTSPKLIPDTESDLRMYKMYIELGKFSIGESSLEAFDAALQTVDGELKADMEAMLSSDEKSVPVKLFSSNRTVFIRNVLYRAQSFMKRQYAIPFLCSTYLLEIYFDLLSKSKSSNYAASFRVGEEKLKKHLQRHAEERMLGAQEAMALTHLLPVFFTALVEQNIFNQADVDKESAKAGAVFAYLTRKFPQDVKRAVHLRLYPGFGQT